MLENDTIRLTSYIKPMYKMIVPTEIEGKKVTVIGGSTFAYRRNINTTKIYIPNTIEKIEKGAFGLPWEYSYYYVYYDGTKAEFDQIMDEKDYISNTWEVKFHFKPCEVHTWNDGKLICEATAEHNGEILYTCVDCGETKSEIIPKIVIKNGWVNEEGNWYYFTNDAAATGWKQVGKAWYYFNKDGVMQTGWIKSGQAWYYMAKSGAMTTGWQKIGSIWYYMNNSGAMQTGWQKIGPTWYYFQSSGAMATGWVKSGSKWYYMNSSGAMLANTSQRINGKTYKFNSSGACTNP